MGLELPGAAIPGHRINDRNATKHGTGAENSDVPRRCPPHQPAPGNAGLPPQFQIGRLWPGVPEPGRWEHSA